MSQRLLCCSMDSCLRTIAGKMLQQRCTVAHSPSILWYYHLSKLKHLFNSCIILIYLLPSYLRTFLAKTGLSWGYKQINSRARNRRQIGLPLSFYLPDLLQLKITLHLNLQPNEHWDLSPQKDKLQFFISHCLELLGWHSALLWAIPSLMLLPQLSPQKAKKTQPHVFCS